MSALNYAPPQAVDEPHLDVRAAVIDHYRRCARELLLMHLVMPSHNPAFQALCADMAECADMSLEEATNLLWPTVQAVYRGACDATTL